MRKQAKKQSIPAGVINLCSSGSEASLPEISQSTFTRRKPTQANKDPDFPILDGDIPMEENTNVPFDEPISIDPISTLQWNKKGRKMGTQNEIMKRNSILGLPESVKKSVDEWMEGHTDCLVSSIDIPSHCHTPLWFGRAMQLMRRKVNPLCSHVIVLH